MFPSVFGNLEWIIAIIVIGSIGYSMIEGWSISDGFYMTIITISTVGYGETLGGAIDPISGAIALALAGAAAASRRRRRRHD